MSKLFSCIVFLIGLIVLIGWTLDIEIIKRIHPDFVAMNPATAVSFILLGLSLFLLNLNPKYKVISTTLSLIVFLIGALKILEVFFGLPIAIDQILFKEKLSLGLDTLPNRMSPNAAMNIMLTGLSLSLFNLHYRFFKIALLLTAIVATISILAIFGYTYNLSSLYGFSSFIPMAVHTAASFLVLSLGIFSTPHILERIKSESSVKKVIDLNIRIKLLISFGLLILLLILFSLITYININIIQNSLIPARSYIRTARIAVLELRRYEKDFLSRDVTGEYSNTFFKTGTSENIKKWEEQYQVFLESVSTLEKFFQLRNDSSREGDINKLRSVSKEYHDYFLYLEEIYLERGFEDYGLEGQMRISISDLESDLTDPSLLVLLLQARRSEKDFFLRNDPSELERFNSSTFELSKKLNGEQLEALNDYVDTFNKIVELETKIGFKIDEGIVGRMRHAINKLEPSLESEEEYVLSLTNQNIEIIERLIISLASVFTILSLMLAYFITNIIARNVSRIEQESAKDAAILNSIGDGVFVVDRNSKIVMMNKVSQLLTGYSNDEAVGRLYTEIFNFRYEKTLDQPYPLFVEEVMKSNKIKTLENHTVLISRDGTHIPIGDSASPVVIGKDEVFGCVVVIRDVTLEHEVDRMKTEFVSVASHELRTPLTAIDGIVSMIRDGEYGPISEDLKQPLEDVNTSSERLIILVNDLLNISRIEQGRLKYTISDFSIAEVISETVHLLQPISKEKNLTLSVSKIDNMVVSADLNKVKEILNNLIGNAIKFTNEGNIDVTTKTKADLVEVYIKDTGIGIASVDESRLFGKFQQIESSISKNRAAGTGLGLHISLEIIQKMGGNVWLAQSEVGKGSTFAFSVPIAKSELAKKVKETIELETKNNPDQKSDTITHAKS